MNSFRIEDDASSLKDAIASVQKNLETVRTVFSAQVNEAQTTPDIEQHGKELVKLIELQVNLLGVLDKLDDRLGKLQERLGTSAGSLDFDAAKQEILERVRKLRAAGGD